MEYYLKWFLSSQRLYLQFYSSIDTGFSIILYSASITVAFEKYLVNKISFYVLSLKEKLENTYIQRHFHRARQPTVVYSATFSFDLEVHREVRTRFQKLSVGHRAAIWLLAVCFLYRLEIYWKGVSLRWWRIKVTEVEAGTKEVVYQTSKTSFRPTKAKRKMRFYYSNWTR